MFKQLVKATFKILECIVGIGIIHIKWWTPVINYIWVNNDDQIKTYSYIAKLILNKHKYEELTNSTTLSLLKPTKWINKNHISKHKQKPILTLLCTHSYQVLDSLNATLLSINLTATKPMHKDISVVLPFLNLKWENAKYYMHAYSEQQLLFTASSICH